ncbi:hypothetical protein QQM79_16665 [Marinobacteraceae bacterium S3BR75-40.1]
MGILNALERAGTVLRQLPSLPWVLSPLDTQAPFSELNARNYPSWGAYAHSIRATLLPVYDPFRPTPRLPRAKPEGQAIQDGEGWYFINGICTDRTVLQINGQALAELFDREIQLLHNPSDGIVLDLVECAIGRTMQIVSDLDEGIADILEDALEHHDKVVLLAHSQGGIIGTTALYRLVRRLKAAQKEALLENVEYYTFASAATEFDLEAVYSEHFFHRNDYVAQIGVAGYQACYSGHFFDCEGSGHLLNTHYLTDLRENRYRSKDGAVSRLLGYIPNVAVARETAPLAEVARQA